MGKLKLTQYQKEHDYRIWKCDKCKIKTIHQPHGFVGTNRRWSCTICKLEGYEDARNFS